MTFISHSCPDLDPQDPVALKECLDRSYVGWDKGLEEVLKRDIQKFVCKDQVVVTPSGSMALLIALRALGVREGTPVLLPAITCWSVYNAVIFLGAKPVVCDVRSPNDFRSCFEAIARKVTEKEQVAIVTHMFGVLIEEEHIHRLKEELKLHVIEDYASSFGALYNNKSPVGKFSDFVIGSFSATKPITAGAGGFIASNKVFMADTHQQPVYGLLAMNCQTSCLNQRLLERQFIRFDNILDKKKQLKRFFSRFVKIFGDESKGLYRAITFDSAEKLRDHLNDQGIQLDIRKSVQPNLAQELGLDLPNARNFEAYSSIPFHGRLLDALELKGLL